MKKLIFLLLLNICYCVSIKAQQNTSVEAVISLLKQMRAGYDSIPDLSFDVSYTYTKQNAPGDILDSLSGRMQASNKQYHWSISNTEMIANSKYVIMLFKEDKLMYITRPGSQNMNFDPLARLDSSLFLLKGLQCLMGTKKNSTTVALNFPESSSYKQVELDIDKNTGFITHSRFVVKQDALQDFGDFDNNIDKVTDNSYCVIEARYYNYSKDSISASLFSEVNYFKRSGSEFSTVAPYNDYKIFIGSPDL